MTLLKMLIVLILNKTAFAENFTCEEMLDEADNISLLKLQTTQRKNIVTCLGHLGKEPLRSSEAVYIWKSIKIYYGDVENIPESILATLHWVTAVIPAEDYYNLTLGSVDVIRNFGNHYNLSDNQLAAVADRVRDDFKEPSDFTCYDLVALNQILCAFNASEIDRIQPKAYKGAFVEIGKLKSCSSDVLRGFAKLATDNLAFGSLEYWDNVVLSSIGVLGEYLPKEIQGRIEKLKEG